MAYELDLPEESKVYNIFHVSRLKKVLGHHIVPSTVLPPLDDEGKLVFVPEAIIDFRERNLAIHYKGVFGEMEGPANKGCEMGE